MRRYLFTLAAAVLEQVPGDHQPPHTLAGQRVPQGRKLLGDRAGRHRLPAAAADPVVAQVQLGHLHQLFGDLHERVE